MNREIDCEGNLISFAPPKTLPTSSEERKQIPLFSGLLTYFPAALAGVARLSKLGNDKHNPGQPLYHAREKSGDHADCLLRHLVDLADAERAYDNGAPVDVQTILDEVSAVCWRALALSQQLHESCTDAPLAPSAHYSDGASDAS